MRIALIGAGTTGVVVSTCLAETGHEVKVYDLNTERLAKLSQGKAPFYEPGLEELLAHNLQAGRLIFTSDPQRAFENITLCLITVGTTRDPQGATDIGNIERVARLIAKHQQGKLTIVIKSAVPVGTNERVSAILKQECKHPFSVISIPEFFREGSAIDDFMRPSRVIVGTQDESARKLMAELHRPYLRTSNPILFMDPKSAELCKLAADALLATRISFMNSIANLCDRVGADVDQVRQGVGTDSRIGKGYLFAGVGYGGPRLSQDTKDLLSIGRQKGLPMEIISACDSINQKQKVILAERVQKRFGANLQGKVFAVWGLAYKPRTDDIREAPAVEIIQHLLQAQATVQVHDPEALESTRKILREAVMYCPDSYQACQGADALLILTEWNQFRQPDLDKLKQLMKSWVVFDGRNVLDPTRMKQCGFEYFGVGRR